VLANGEVTVAELAEYVNVSTDTVRRDLDDLNLEGILIRTHGGAISPKLVPKLDSNLDIRLGIEVARKEAIGRAAASIIKDNSVVIMNSGTTVLAVAKALNNHVGLTIATNNLHVAKEIKPESVRALHIFGGTVLHSSQATIGPVNLFSSTGEVLDFRCDLALIAIGGIDHEYGYSVTNLGEASMFKQMMAQASKVGILADETKVGLKLFAKLGNLSEADYYITDTEPNKFLGNALEKAKVQIILPPN
jgi:DeoR/GlpR family transcriptional regulator of sugar metabolism